MKDFVFVTGNPKKAKDISDFLGTSVSFTSVETDEIQEMDLAKIVEHKVREAWNVLKRPVIIEDVGLYVDAWNGFPCPFIKWLHHTMGYDQFPKAVPKNNRKVTVIVMYGVYDGKKMQTFEGKSVGTLAFKQRGAAGWGFDTLFIPKGQTKTVAELGEKINKKTLVRIKALTKLKKFLEK